MSWSYFWGIGHYDELGHQTARWLVNGGATFYEYDDKGNKVAERDALGHRQTWAFDEANRLISHTDLGGRISHYTYNQQGLLVSEQSSAGKNTHYGYYSDGHLQSYEDKSRGEKVDYTYDAEGNLSGKDSNKLGDWIVEMDRYAYDSLGRLISIRRRNPDDTNAYDPNKDRSVLSVDYEYDAVGNIRDTKVMSRYGGARVDERTYFTYDETNRLLINKGQLDRGEIRTTSTQGTSLSYDASGNILSATRYEAGAWQTYQYTYNSSHQLERIRLNGIDLETRRYDIGGQVIEDNRYDATGFLLETQLMSYQQGRLSDTVLKSFMGQEVGRTHYTYDAMGNMTDMVSMTYAVSDSIPGYTQAHHYDYQLWDTYQQSVDTATLSVDGYQSTTGQSLRRYDVNGLLSETIDSTRNGNSMNNSTQYLTSSLEGIKARKDRNGQTSYLTVAGKTIGDVQVDFNGVAHLDMYAGFTPMGKPENVAMEATSGAGVLPEMPSDGLGSYTLQVGDSLEGIALQVYGDSSLWYLIADANGISERYAHAGEVGSPLHAGQRLRLPPAASAHHTSQTKRVLNEASQLGITSATTLLPAPPEPKRPSPWRHVAKICVAVIATVATVMSAGIVATMMLPSLAGAAGVSLGGLISTGFSVLGGSSALGVTGTLITGFTAGFIGSLTAQGAANALALQKGIDWKSALFSGLATAATAGMGRVLSEVKTYQALTQSMDNLPHDLFSTRTAVEMMERDVVNQSIHLAQGHQHFDWTELGTSAVTAGILGATYAQKASDSINQHLGASGKLINSELSSLAQGSLSGTINHNGINVKDILLDNLGSAVGNAALEATAVIGQQQTIDAANQALNTLMIEQTGIDSLVNAGQDRLNHS